MASSQQDEDTSVFEAALSFVDEFDHTLTIAVGAKPPPSLSREETRRLRAEKKRMLRKAGIYSDPNRARNEHTREIAFLREQLEKLQLDLHVLQKTKKKGLIAQYPVTQRPSLWQEQARRQRCRREQAECDNVRLKLAVERQKSGRQSRAAGAQEDTAIALINQCCNERPIIGVSYFCGDVEDFRELFCRLDGAYHDLDAIFMANGLTNRSVSIPDVQLREGVDGKYLEFFTYKDLPFGLQDTAQASWDYFKGAEKHMAYGN
ncbi:hypothetical protein GN244_ATG00230 [Phytophthora infestans]|uniref:Uncharacterized protein n=1 Tax=Phytophthora infestans TaxID=4787 RepID=A0A833SEF5_PHYIN|nr:hypothetical protein GN244_ATG00230 [Phytophthora infestans]